MAKKNKDGSALPQIIAHRGFRAQYPENTMLSFRSAVAAGAEAIETDMHLTKDNVAVLSHDSSLKRCFGKNQLIADHEWEYISTLRTIAPPHESMPRLVDLLRYLAEPGLEDVWVLLDIKVWKQLLNIQGYGSLQAN
ncbi:MAG: hypothetical protein LQ340_007911 [Diploschistes diacapsis]|nr:MAG: hypothetical protein LQ340_007911 [Diploschistes diacapsis]